jgi:hypothetical protein
VARWDCGAKWAEGPAPQAQCGTPLGLTLSEGLGLTRGVMRLLSLPFLRCGKADGLYLFSSKGAVECIAHDRVRELTPTALDAISLHLQ